LKSLLLRVVETNQFIEATDQENCKVQRIDEKTIQLTLTFYYSYNILKLIVRKEDGKYRITIGEYSKHRENHHCDLYVVHGEDKRKHELLMGHIGGEELAHIGQTITYPRPQEAIAPQAQAKPLKPEAKESEPPKGPNISVVVITRNRKEVLEEMLSSLSSQVRPGDTILVVDDDSIDGTKGLVESKFPRVRYTRMKHEGYRLSTLRNRGILEAWNNTIICVDGDCTPRQGFLEEHRKNAGSGKLLLGGVEYLDQGEKVIGSNRDDPILKGSLEGGYGGNICFDKLDALRVGLFDEDYNGFWGFEDTDFVVKMRESGVRVIQLFSATVQHHWHPSDKRFIEEGRQRNSQLIKEKFEAYKKGVFTHYSTLLIVVDQYGWAWDIASRELLHHIRGYRGAILSAGSIINNEVDTSKFDVVLVWYWIMREGSKMVADPRVLEKLNPENTILCVAGEHVLYEGFKMDAAKRFRFIGANNKKIYGLLKAQAPDKEIAILSHGVDLDRFQPKPPREPSKTFTVGWVGSTQRRSKRYGLAVEALEGMPEAALKVAGHINTREYLPRDKMPAFYHSLDCLLVTSETESHPLVVYEAMASGVPVITTDVGDVGETIVHGKNGLLLPVNCTVEDIRGAIGRLRESPALAQSLAVNARKTVEEKWNWPLISKQYLDFFRLVGCKFTVSMLVSRDNELFERAVASVVRQRPTEFRAYIDPLTLKDQGKAKRILAEAGAKVYIQTYNPEYTSYQLHTFDVAHSVHRAIAEAENKWVCWIDDDDEIIGDRRQLLMEYASDDVGLIHGDVTRVYPYTTQLKKTEPVTQPREAERCIGSGKVYNRDAFNEVHRHIDDYMNKNVVASSYWDYMIAYWMKRAGRRIVYVPEVLSIQNVNLEHPPERKKLYGLWSGIIDELDKIELT